MRETEHSKHLAWTDLEELLWEESAQDWHRRISSLQSNNLANLHRIVISRLATPRQLCQLFNAHRECKETLSELQKWEKQCQKYSPTLLEGGIGFRKKAHRVNDFLVYQYQARRPNRETSRRRYVIGLTGDSGLLMAPIPFILEALGLLGWDLLLVRRLRRESFLDGNGSRLEDLATGLLQILPTFRRRAARADGITVLGTSAGALAALVLAEHLGARQGIALGALASAALLEPGGRLELSRRRLVQRARTPLLLAYPASHAADEDHAWRIAAKLVRSSNPPVELTLRGYQGCTNHTLHAGLVDQGWTLVDIHQHLLDHGGGANGPPQPPPPIGCQEECLSPPA